MHWLKKSTTENVIYIKSVIRNGTEAVAQWCSVKEMFLEISKNPQENVCARAYFLKNISGGYFWRKDNLKTPAVYIEISLVSWNLPNGPKHRGSIFKNVASSEEAQQLARAFPAITDKIEADIL